MAGCSSMFCPASGYVEGRFTGTRNGGPVNISFRFTNDGMGGLVYGGFLREDRPGQ